MAITLPIAAASTANVDSSTDGPDQARADIYDAITKLNTMLANLSVTAQVGTIAVRDTDGKLAGDITGNAATASTSAACSGNSATATTAGSASAAASLSVPLTWDKKPAFRGALVYSNAVQASTILTFPYESYDTDSIHSTSVNTARLTVPTGVTKVRLTALVKFNTTSMYDQTAFISQNGYAGGVGLPWVSTTSTEQELQSGKILLQSAVVPVSAGDYFNAEINTGTATSGCWFAMEIIE